MGSPLARRRRADAAPTARAARRGRRETCKRPARIASRCDLFLAEFADWAGVAADGFALPPVHARRQPPPSGMVKNTRFSGASTMSGPSPRRHYIGTYGGASAGGKVYPGVDLSHLLKITSALLKGRLWRDRYHGCRKLSTHVSLRHICLSVSCRLLLIRAMDWLDRR